MKSSILKNSAYLWGGQVFIKLVAFFYNIYLANSLGVSDFGLYSVALSYFSLISPICDFGILRYLVREVAKDRKELTSIMSNVFIIRALFMVVVFIFFSALVYIFDPDKLRASLEILAIFAVVPQALSLTLDGIFIAIQKVSLSAIGSVILNLATTITGFLLISSGLGSHGAVYALIIGQIIYALFLFVLYIKEGFKFRLNFKYENVKPIILGSLPYGILGVLGLIYFKIDTLLLSYMKGSYDTGLYSAAYKFLEALVFIPSSVATASFPVLARLHEEDREQIKQYYFKSLKLLGVISLIIVVLYILFLPTVIKLFLPQFEASIGAILILAWTIPFMFIHIPGTIVLLSTDKYLKPVIYLSIFTVSFNVIANLIFIPEFGFIASSWITVLSEVLSFLVFFVLLQKKVFKK